MGIKKNFSQDPIDHHKVRKSDKKLPPKRFYRKFKMAERKIEDTKIISIGSKKSKPNEKGLVLYIPGGAFISGPVQHHWDALSAIVENTAMPVCLVDYPKAPEFNIQQINHNIDRVYAAVLEEYADTELILIGDSVGGTLIMSLVQRLIAKNERLPSKLVLITPVFDASMTNPEIEKIDKEDPMLSKAGILSAKKMCAQDMSLTDPIISPLYGSFKGFPETMLLIAGKDIMYCDGVLGGEKMRQAGVKLDLISEPEMPHVYPLLPVMLESKNALSDIICKIKL